MMITLGLAFIFVPLDVAFCYGQRRLNSSPIISFTITYIGESDSLRSTDHFHSETFSDIICLMGIAINFRSSYQDHRTKQIVLEGRKIALHYVGRYFWVDLLSSFPDRIVLNWVRKSSSAFNSNSVRNIQLRFMAVESRFKRQYRERLASLHKRKRGIVSMLLGRCHHSVFTQVPSNAFVL